MVGGGRGADVSSRILEHGSKHKVGSAESCKSNATLLGFPEDIVAEQNKLCGEVFEVTLLVIIKK
jgi:hypothetical protein